MSEWIELDEVDVWTAGTVGEPGARTFFLQARQGGTVATVKCEKQQVDALAAHLLGELGGSLRPDDVPDGMELVEPEAVQFVAGDIGVGRSEDADLFTIVVHELTDDDAEDEDEGGGGGQLRVTITPEQALAFAGVATRVVAAGRPTCRFCKRPDEPGHLCPPMN